VTSCKMTSVHLVLGKLLGPFLILLIFCFPQFGLAESSVGGATDTPSGESVEQWLRQGNSRFAHQEMKFDHQNQERRGEISKGQKPLATILSCSDSRVPDELVFDAGLGDIFVVRVAGNVADGDEIASVEYGVEHLETPLLVVMGHTSCGAVTASVENAGVGGSIPELIDNIAVAVKRAQRRVEGLSVDKATLIKCAIEENVWKSIEDLITRSPAIYERVNSGKLRIVGAIYNLATGEVAWLGPHIRQMCLELRDEPYAANPKPTVKAGSSTKEAVAPKQPEGVTSDLAMLQLREGNKRFVADNRVHPNLNPSRREEIQNGQHPYATILTCSDSRVAPELIFDAGLGDLFVVRFAGNVADVDEIGTIEYGAGHLNTPLLVVMGHTKCGAVTAVSQHTEFHGHLKNLTDNILPAVKAALTQMPTADSEDLIEAASVANVWQSINDILSKSPEVAHLASTGFLQVVGAIYHIEDGYVEWLGPHPGQTQILAKHARAAKTNRQQNDSGYESSQNAYENGESEN
jgi:carbonic anhydrase